jgi:hypothetical protein
VHRFSRWRVPLSEAATVADVIGLMRDYLAKISPEDIGKLPPPCWDCLTTRDIASSAVVLIREEIHFAGEGDAAEVLHEIAHTFVAASTRIAAIQARDQPIDSGE